MTPESPAPRFAVPENIDTDLLTGFDRAAVVVDLCGETMGTTWSVRVALSPGTDRTSLANRIQARLDGIVGQMSHWEPSSLLCRYNAAEPGTWAALPPDFAKVVAAALVVAERSNGAFDPAVGRLADVWGLGPTPAAGTPAPTAIAEALGAGGWQRLAFDAQAARLRQPGGLWLDLSGIAKGFAVDAVTDMLTADGLRHSFVEIGGECAGRGMKPDGDPWWVEVETPPGFDVAPLRIALHGLGIATSGDYLRGAHTLDPSTGYPPAGAATAVTAVHPSCMMADAWASALGVRPLTQARSLAERERLSVRLLGRDGSEWLSSEFLRML